ncbi:MAG: hypothetical protein GC137_10420 [Alphaproteobacteria bacterium]|nr:hypothetical protein [Alphaproteobacteria bacterium]
MNIENAYTPEFFTELFNILGIEDHNLKLGLNNQIYLSAKSYIRSHSFYETSLPPNEIKREMQKACTHLKKAEASLEKVLNAGNFRHELIDSFCRKLEWSYPSLKGHLNEIREQPLEFGINKVDAPKKVMQLLYVILESIEFTIDTVDFRKFKKSRSLNHWIISIAPVLEPIIGHKLEQSRYHKGEYISKREISDSELLKFIIEPLDPSVTISQIETAIKETHKERHA